MGCDSCILRRMHRADYPSRHRSDGESRTTDDYAFAVEPRQTATTVPEAAMTEASSPPTTNPPTTPPLTTAPTPTSDQLGELTLSLQPYVSVPAPDGVAWRTGDEGIYVAGQHGEVWRIIGGVVQPDLVIDLTNVVAPNYSELGLLGIAFSPKDQRMYLDYTDTAIVTRVVSYRSPREGHGQIPRGEVLSLPQTGFGHHGGALVFDTDGYLYIALGDGSDGHTNEAQDFGSLRGSILRVMPRGSEPGYDVPGDNPFAGREGIRPEIWAKGFRNPRDQHRSPTGDMWMGDVGDRSVEEVDRMPGGQSGWNFGWPYYEGSRERRGNAPGDLVPPVFEFPHSTGIAVIGGYVYRGSAIRGLAGAYVFGDLTGKPGRWAPTAPCYCPSTSRVPRPPSGRVPTASSSSSP